MQQELARLRQRLRKHCNRRASKLGVGLTPACRNLMDRMINNGVERMVSQGAVEREEQILVAERNLAYYVQRLSTEAQRTGTYPRVDGKVFDTVFNIECPLWPYC